MFDEEPIRPFPPWLSMLIDVDVDVLLDSLAVSVASLPPGAMAVGEGHSIVMFGLRRLFAEISETRGLEFPGAQAAWRLRPYRACLYVSNASKRRGLSIRAAFSRRCELPSKF